MWRRTLALAVGLSGLALAAVVVALAPGAPDDRLPDGGLAAGVLIVVVGVGFIGVGTFAMLRRPENRTGALLAAFGICALVSSLSLSNARGPYLLAHLCDSLTLAIFVHLLLAFPSGRLEDRPSRFVVGAGYVATAGASAVSIVFGGPAGVYGCSGCPSNPVLIDRQPGLADALSGIAGMFALALVIAAIVLTIRRWRRANPIQRRALGPPLATGAVILMFALGWIVLQSLDVGHRTEKVAQIVFLSTFVALPIAFLAGLLRVRFFRAASVSRLIDRLAEGPGAGGLEAALAEALDDPSVTVAYWLPERQAYVDHDGRALELPADGDGRVATEITHRDRHVGALIHGAALLEDPTLVRAVTGAAALALENGRLEAELRARLEALRASRARIVEAGDAERRRLGRDLHDGAQQRLVSILLQLQLARQKPELADDLVERALDDARAAVEELRELAAGIHPAVLAQRGLGAGLESLATRAAVPVELESELEERFPAAVESAAYFVVAEALTNVAKYAGATYAQVGARRLDGALIVEIRDDGAGGADAAGGSGLRGLEDRVGALGGTLEVDSPPGAGTVVRARIPL